MKANYKVSRTYTEVTPESVAEGDFSDCGFVFKEVEMDLQDVLRELRDCCELSVSPARVENMSGMEWASSESQVSDYATGTEKSESVHIKGRDGERLPPRRLHRIFRMAGLAK